MDVLTRYKVFITLWDIKKVTKVITIFLLCCKQLQEIIKNIIFFLIFSAEYDIIFLKIRKIAMNHLD